MSDGGMLYGPREDNARYIAGVLDGNRIKQVRNTAVIALSSALLSGCRMDGTVAYFDENDLQNGVYGVLALGGLWLAKQLYNSYSNWSDERNSREIASISQDRYNEQCRHTVAEFERKTKEIKQREIQRGRATEAERRFEKQSQPARREIEDLKNKVELADIARGLAERELGGKRRQSVKTEARAAKIAADKQKREILGILGKAGSQVLRTEWIGDEKITTYRNGRTVRERIKKDDDF